VVDKREYFLIPIPFLHLSQSGLQLAAGKTRQYGHVLATQKTAFGRLLGNKMCDLVKTVFQAANVMMR
jgi:hypothetical protein